MFKDDKCNGEGELHYPDGKIYAGQWNQGKKNGAAVYSWPNGAKYFVTYKDGKMQGEGRLVGATVPIE
jgi:hypothetical protein